MSQQRTKKNTPDGSGPSPDDGEYIVLNGQRLELHRHPTDFSIIGDSAAFGLPAVKARHQLSHNMTRVQAKQRAERDELMNSARRDSVAHHIYLVKGTDEELIIDDRILLTLERPDPQLLEDLMREFYLRPEGRMGEAHILRLTSASDANPLKLANRIAGRPGVRECHPQVLVDQQLSRF